MKKFLSVLAVSLMLVSGYADARGGGSSGGGGHGGGGGHSSASAGGRSSSSGGFSSSAGRPNSVAAAPSSRTTTTTTTTTSRSANGSYYSYHSPYVGGGMMYGGWGMGYGYTNGLVTGMIIANMMHPHNTVMYVGPGTYSNNALLYPDGRVVNQQGYQVGTYINGQFTAVNGGMVAQQVPADAGAQVVQPQPVVIQNTGPSAGDVLAMVLLGFVAILFFLILIGMLV